MLTIFVQNIPVGWIRCHIFHLTRVFFQIDQLLPVFPRIVEHILVPIARNHVAKLALDPQMVPPGFGFYTFGQRSEAQAREEFLREKRVSAQ